ncbi:MAG TPA: hypothetical protein VIM44_04985 [Rariglobus sp.]
MSFSSMPAPDWRWGTSEGSREFDRLCDRRLSFVEKVRWLEEAEALSLAMRLKKPLASGGGEAPLPPASQR